MLKNDKGPNDLEEQIDMLTKQKEYLQKKCKQAGIAILKQESRYESLEKEYNKVCEERDNYIIMLGDENIQKKLFDEIDPLDDTR